MPYDEIPRVSMKDAEVVSSKYLAHTRKPILTIWPDGIKFNQESLRKIPDVTFILPEIDRGRKLFFAVASYEDEIDSQKWANQKEDKRESRKITGRELGAKIYRLMGWNKGYYYKAYGSLAVRDDGEEEIVLCYELADADKSFLTEKARMTLNISVEDLGSEAERILAEDARRKAEKAQREKDKAEGKTPQKKKNTTTHTKAAGEGEFGKKHDDHMRQFRFTRSSDGQVMIDDIEVLTNMPGKAKDPPRSQIAGDPMVVERMKDPPHNELTWKPLVVNKAKDPPDSRISEKPPDKGMERGGFG